MKASLRNQIGVSFACVERTLLSAVDLGFGFWFCSCFFDSPQVRDTSRSNPKVKSGGQECPPHTGGVAAARKLSVMSAHPISSVLSHCLCRADTPVRSRWSWSWSGSVLAFFGSLLVTNKIKSSPKVKSGGQECPPHTCVGE